MTLISSNGTGGGNWSDPSTWDGGVVPSEGDCVTIVAGDVVTIDDAAPATIIVGDDHVGASYAIRIYGTLQYLASATVDHVFRTKGDFRIESGGSLQVGTPENPIPASRTFTIELNYSDSPADGKYGLLNYGEMILQGDPNRVNVIKCMLNADAEAGATSLVTDVETGWKDNDDIAIASTTRTWSEAEHGKVNGDASGTTVNIDGFGGSGGGLAYAHSGTPPTQAEIINLTRNVKVTSYNTDYRGYVCCYPGSTADVDYVEFYMLGRDVAYKHGIEIRTTAVNATNFAYCSIWGLAASNSPFYLYQAQHVVIDNCVIYNTARKIMIYTNAYNNQITNNVLMKINDNMQALYIYNVSNTIDGNTITSCRFDGFYVYDPSNRLLKSLKNNTVHSCDGRGFFVSITGTLVEDSIDGITCWRNNLGGIEFYHCGYVRAKNFTLFGNNVRNISLKVVRLSLKNLTSNGDSKYSTLYGISFDDNSPGCEIEDGIFSEVSGIKTAHSSADIFFSASVFGSLILRRSKLLASTQVRNINNAIPGSFVQCEDLDQIQYNDKAWYKYGIVTRDSSISKTGSYSIRFDRFWSANGWLEYELEVPVKAGESVVVSAWLRKNAAYTSANRPKIRLSGMGISEVEAQMSDVTDTWEKVSVAGTPTRTGFAKLTIMTYLTNPGASAWCDFERVGVTQPVLNTLEGDFWADGHMAKILFDTGSITAKEFWETLLTDVDKAGSFGNLIKEYIDEKLSKIKADTHEIQSKLPDDYIAGSSDKSSLESKHGGGSWEGTTPEAIDAVLTKNHGAGSWKGGGGGGGGGCVWYPQDKEDVIKALKDLGRSEKKELELLANIEGLVQELRDSVEQRVEALSAMMSKLPEPVVKQIKVLLDELPEPVTVEQVVEVSRKLDDITKMVVRLLRDEDIDEILGGDDDEAVVS